MQNKKILEFMLKNEVLYSIIIKLDNYEKITCGWKYKLPDDDLLSSFHDEESVKGINEYLKGKMMPQSMGQGKTTCVLCKPNANILVGLFYIETKDIVESYHFEKQLNNELAEIFND